MQGNQTPRRAHWSGPVLLAILAAYIVGFFVYIADIPRTQPEAPHADAIVALTGSMGRLGAATALFESGVGRRMLISGVHRTTTKEDLRAIVHGGPRYECCADMGFAATSTHTNAIETAEWMQAHHYKSLIVVTAAYHMPRSLTEFSARMPHVKLIAYPVESENVDVDGWWRSPLSFSVLQWEYAKYLGALALTKLFPPHADPRDGRQSGNA